MVSVSDLLPYDRSNCISPPVIIFLIAITYHFLFSDETGHFLVRSRSRLLFLCIVGTLMTCLCKLLVSDLRKSHLTNFRMKALVQIAVSYYCLADMRTFASIEGKSLTKYPVLL